MEIICVDFQGWRSGSVQSVQVPLDTSHRCVTTENSNAERNLLLPVISAGPNLRENLTLRGI